MPPFGRQSSQRRQAPPAVTLDFTDHFTFMENCLPTPPLSQHLYLPGAIGFCTYLSLKAKCWLGGGVGGQFPRKVNDPILRRIANKTDYMKPSSRLFVLNTSPLHCSF